MAKTWRMRCPSRASKLCTHRYNADLPGKQNMCCKTNVGNTQRPQNSKCNSPNVIIIHYHYHEDSLDMKGVNIKVLRLQALLGLLRGIPAAATMCRGGSATGPCCFYE